MNKVINTLLISACLLVGVQFSVCSQGLYSKPEKSTELIQKESLRLNKDKQLKAPGDDPNAPDEDPVEPGIAPVSDGFWILIALGVLYAILRPRQNNSSKVYGKVVSN